MKISWILCSIDSACIRTLYVSDTALIDVAEHENCILQIDTDQNHILRFSLAHGEHFERAQEFVSVGKSVFVFATLMIRQIFYL